MQAVARRVPVVAAERAVLVVVVEQAVAVAQVARHRSGAFE